MFFLSFIRHFYQKRLSIQCEVANVLELKANMERDANTESNIQTMANCYMLHHKIKCNCRLQILMRF